MKHTGLLRDQRCFRTSLRNWINKRTGRKYVAVNVAFYGPQRPDGSYPSHGGGFYYQRADINSKTPQALRRIWYLDEKKFMKLYKQVQRKSR